MVDFLGSLRNVHLSVSGGSKEQMDNLYRLVGQLDWAECAKFVVTEFEAFSSPEDVINFQQSTAFQACWASLELLLKQLPSAIPVSTSEAATMIEFLKNWLRLYATGVAGRVNAVLIRNKMSQFMSLAVRRYFPVNWPTLFDDVLALFSELGARQMSPGLSDTNPALLNLLEIFLVALKELDEIAFDRSLNLGPELSNRVAELKDSMRESCLPSIMELMALFMCNLKCDKPKELELLVCCLEVMGRYALWIDLKLIVNDAFLEVLRSFLQDPKDSVLEKVCFLIKKLVAKGMPELPGKLNLIIGLWSRLLQPIIDTSIVNKVLQCSLSKSNRTGNCEMDIDLKEYADFLEEFSECMCVVGLNLVSVYKSLMGIEQSRRDANWQSAYEQCVEKLEITSNIAVKLVAFENDCIGIATVDFLQDYMDILKSKELTRPSKNAFRLDLTPGRVLKMRQLLTFLLDKLKYPVEDTEEDINEFETNRPYFLGLLRSISAVDVDLVLDFIDSIFQQSVCSLPSNRQLDGVSESLLGRLDASLYIFYTFGEFSKAPRNDHFAPTYKHADKMRAIMGAICESNVASLPYFPIQLNFFEIIGRYDKFFTFHPASIFEVLGVFFDARGLHNPDVRVRSRASYIFSRLVKSHRTLVASHTEAILRELESLLPINSTPDLSNLHKGLNGFARSSVPQLCQDNGSGVEHLFSITEQSFLYEACAHLIMARAAVHEAGRGVQEAVNLFTMLLRPAIVQFPGFVRLLGQETNQQVAEARGTVVKNTADLITRTTRVMATQAEYVPILMEILQVMVGSLTLLPTIPGVPGRGAACAGVRAYIHRLIGSIGPECVIPVKVVASATHNPLSGSCIGNSNGDGVNGGGNQKDEEQQEITRPACEVLLMAITSATPYFIAVHHHQSADLRVSIQDPDVRYKELRDHIPLFIQLTVRYKERCVEVLSQCVSPLIAATVSAVSEPLEENHGMALLERTDLRRTLLQLLQTIGQVIPQGIFPILGSEAPSIMVSLLGLTELCLNDGDPVGLRNGLAFFGACVTHFGASDEAFYKEFLLPHLVPLLFLVPASPKFNFLIADFVAALNEATASIYALNSARGDVFQEYLRQSFFPQQNLNPEYTEAYISHLCTQSLPQFQEFVKSFYLSFR